MLIPAAFAITTTAGVAFLMLHALQQSAAFDLTGYVETLLPLAQLGVVTAPLIVAVRALIATTIAWLVAGALDEPIPFGTIAANILVCMPLLELPALVDALAMLRHPDAPFAAVHIPLGVDAFVHATSQGQRVLAQTVNLALIAFTALLAYRLTKRSIRRQTVAIPAALAVALVFAVMPLLRV